MGRGLGIIGLIIWVAIVLPPVTVAGPKGPGSVCYSCLSLLFFPLALIMARLASDRVAGAPWRVPT
jgi:hypothetical protein